MPVARLTGCIQTHAKLHAKKTKQNTCESSNILGENYTRGDYSDTLYNNEQGECE